MSIRILCCFGLFLLPALPATALDLHGRNVFTDPDGGRAPLIEPDGTIVIPHADDGTYRVEVRVNGVLTKFIVDTGANYVAFTVEDARRVGIDVDSLSFSGLAETPNGEVKAAYTILESMSLNGHRMEDVEAVVIKGEMPGALLGMSYLSRLKAMTLHGGRLTLTP